MNTLCLLVLLANAGGLQSARPASLVLLVDVSDSLATGVIKQDRALVAEVTDALAAALQPGDTVHVGTFGDAITIDPVALDSADAVREAGARLGGRLGGGSPIWDALVAAAAVLDGTPMPRGIIILTDGRSNGNRVGFAEALARLRQLRVPVFVVSLDKSNRPIPDPGARLEQLARDTGGTCLFVERAALPAAIARSVSSLRQVSATARPRRNNY